MLQFKNLKPYGITTKDCILSWPVLTILTFILYWILWDYLDPGHYFYPSSIFCWNTVVDLGVCAILCLSAIIVTLLTNHFLRKIMSSIWAFIFACFVTLIINLFFSEFVKNIVNHHWYTNFTEHIAHEDTMIVALLSTSLSIIVLTVIHHRNFFVELQEKQELRMLLMKRQLEPHFLYNSLGALIDLMEGNERAQQYAVKLSRVYRHIIEMIPKQLTELPQSMEFLENYMALIEIRFPSHFIIEIDSKIKNSNYYIVPFAVQVVTENIVKHNIHSNTAPIKIIFTLEKDTLLIKNTYRPVKESVNDSAHIGLSNLDNLCFLTTNRHIEWNDPKDYYLVKIPLIKVEHESINN